MPKEAHKIFLMESDSKKKKDFKFGGFEILLLEGHHE